MATAAPFGSCLHSTYETPPKSVVPAWFRPLNGVPYKVASGDTFASLAAFGSMNVWDLIYFNYQTKDPREVNWYLHHRTGCKTQDWDAKNFKFDDLDDPGVIYIPQKAYERMLDAGLKPAKFYDEEEQFRVRGRVPTYSQNFKTVTCWAIAGSMMLSWRNPYLTSVNEALNSVGSKWWDRYDANQGLEDPEMHEFTSRAGLSRGGLLDTPDMWVWMLNKFGPLMVIRPSAPGYVHWVVVTGYHIVPTSTFNLYYTEPSNGAHKETDWSNLTNDAKRASGALPAMYYWR
jgi:hypothetical protein